MNDLFRIMELPPDENETLVGEEWRWNDATWASGMNRLPGWTWRATNQKFFKPKQKPE